MRFLVVFVLCVPCLAQLPIPHRPLNGFVYKTGIPEAPVHFDTFIDNLCTASREAYPTIQAVADHYGIALVRLTAHLFPLSKHRNAFLATKAAFAVDNITRTNLTYKWMETVYANLESFSEDATMHITEVAIIEKFATLAAGMSINKEVFYKQYNDAITSPTADLNWKYACSRAVTGTPTFFINDVLVDAAPSWTLKDWMAIIDPLLGRSSEVEMQGKNLITVCPPNTKNCTYLPGKFECCLKDESCIINVGCRC